jgi:hypothetical protein
LFCKQFGDGTNELASPHEEKDIPAIRRNVRRQLQLADRCPPCPRKRASTEEPLSLCNGAPIVGDARAYAVT